MTNNTKPCQICGEGELTNHTEKNDVTYRDQTAQINHLFSVCDICGCDQVGPTELKANKLVMIVFKKRVDELLSVHEV